MARFKWNTKQLLAKVDKAGSASVEESCELLLNSIETKMKAQESGRPHIPSKPGEVPAPDTKLLIGSMSYQTSDGKSSGVTSPASQNDGIKKPAKKKDQIIGVIGSNVEYANYLESGTSKMLPRPYLRPALSGLFTKILSIFKKNGRKFIK